MKGLCVCLIFNPDLVTLLNQNNETFCQKNHKTLNLKDSVILQKNIAFSRIKTNQTKTCKQGVCLQKEIFFSFVKIVLENVSSKPNSPKKSSFFGKRAFNEQETL